MSQTVPETSLGLNRQGLAWVNTMVDLGILDNAVVAAANTVQGLKDALDAAVVPETSKRFVEETTRSGGSIDRSVAIGVLSDAIIAPLTTVTGLRALFTDQDTTLTATDRYSQVA
jgi:hypothetical protein